MAPNKTKKMSIGTFLADESYGSWADEMDDMPIPLAAEPRGFGGERRGFSNAPTYTQDDRGFMREELPLPSSPPYTAHIGNLSFDATSEDVSALFDGCEVTSVRIVEDKLTRAPKGFGYVEFGTVEGLKKAITFQGASLQGRNIRVSVAEPPKDRHEVREISDWTRKGPLPDAPSQRRVPDRAAFGSRAPDNMSDGGNERPSRRPYEQPADGKMRDFSSWERKGPLSPSMAPPQMAREGGRPRSREAPQFRRASPAWGEGRSQDGSRPPRREFQERPAAIDRAPTAPELDNQWRARMRPDAPVQAPAAAAAEETVASPTSTGPPSATAAPTVRPKLNLQKRTVAEATASPTATGDSKSSPFGGARPIDTFAREKEVEEKRELAIRQKKEADDKAKAERAEKQKAAKEEEQEQAKEQEAAAQAPADTNGNTETSTSAAPQAGKAVEVLQRTEEAPATAAGGPAAETAEKAPSTVEKTEASQDKSRPQASSRPGGNWRSSGRGRGGGHPQGPRQSSHHGQRGPPRAQQAEAAPAAPQPTTDEDGWSTVGSKPRNNRRGNYNRG